MTSQDYYNEIIEKAHEALKLIGGKETSSIYL